MGWVTVVENLAEPQSAITEEWSDSYIEFLELQYPNGFTCPHRSYLNGGELKVVDYDVVLGDDDRVVLVITPADPISLIATALISIAVSFAVNYVVNKLFPPKKPASAELASAETPTAGTVYSLTVPTNSAKLGDPIPVIYGRVMATPDIASFAYSYFLNNQNIVDVMLCLGNGEFDIHEVYISSTPASQMNPGSFGYVPFAKSAHQETFGNIQWWYHNAGQPIFYENVSTSVEVSGQILTPGQTNSALASTNSSGQLVLPSPLPGGVVIGHYVYPTSALYQRFNKDSHPITAIDASRTVITSSLPWYYAYSLVWNTVGVTKYYYDPSMNELWLYHDGAAISNSLASSNTTGVYMDTITILNDTNEVTTVQGVFIGNGGAGTAEIYRIDPNTFTGVPLIANGTPPTPANSITIVFHVDNTLYVAVPTGGFRFGPYAAAAPDTLTSEIHIDLIMPDGLYWMADDGGLWRNTVELIVEITPINDAGEAIGAATYESIVISEATNTPIRRTYMYVRSVGRYAVSMWRSTASSGRAQDRDAVHWYGLKAVLYSTGRVYGDTTLLTCRFVSSEAVSGDITNRIGVDCTRLLPVGGASSNVADHVRDIVTNTVYGGKRPVGEIDAPALTELRAASKGFNGIFDQKISLWSALEAVMQPTRASPVTDGQLISAVIDAAQTTPKFAFTQSNIVKDSVSYEWSFDQVGDKDGFEVEWRNPVTWVAEYEIYPSSSIDPESVTLMGCTSASIAQAHAKYLWQRRLYNRKTVKFKTELDGHLPQLNDKISVTTDLGGAEDYLVVTVSYPDEFHAELECVKYDARVYS